MKENACTVIGLHLTELSVQSPSRWILRRLLGWWRQERSRLTGLLATSLSTILLGALYFLCLTLFLQQLAEHGW